MSNQVTKCSNDWLAIRGNDGSEPAYLRIDQVVAFQADGGGGTIVQMRGGQRHHFHGDLVSALASHLQVGASGPQADYDL